jgi:hypothetical protein
MFQLRTPFHFAPAREPSRARNLRAFNGLLRLRLVI